MPLAAEAPARIDWLLYAVAGAILTYVWRIQDLYSIFGQIKFPILASLAALGLYVADHDRRRALRTILGNPVTKGVIAIMLLAVLSVPTSVHDGMSFRFIKDDLGKNFILMLIIAASVRNFADARRYALVLLVGGIVYAQYVYLNVAVGQSGRLGNLAYYDANDLGMLLVCAFPVALYFVLRGKHMMVRILATMSLALFLLVIIKTGSRGAFLGVIGMALYFLFAFSSVPRKTRILAVVSAFLTLVLVGSEQYWAMMGTLLHPKDDYNWSGGSDSGRMEVWARGMGYMLANPLTGVGVSAFPIAEGKISALAGRQNLGIGLKWSAAHNSFVQIGAELGVFGLASFCILLWCAYRAARSVGVFQPSSRGPPTDEMVLGQALAGSVVGYAVCGFFLSQAYAAFAFTLYGLIVGLAKVAPEAAIQAPLDQRSSTRLRQSVAARR